MPSQRDFGLEGDVVYERGRESNGMCTQSDWYGERYGELQGGGSVDGLHRYELQDRYLELTRHSLPAIARLKGWSLKEDHCFMRVILDQLFQDCWYNHLDRRLRAYKQLNEAQLRRAIYLGKIIESGDVVTLERWNRESLHWRKKNPKVR